MLVAARGDKARRESGLVRKRAALEEAELAMRAGTKLRLYVGGDTLGMLAAGGEGEFTVLGTLVMGTAGGKESDNWFWRPFPFCTG